MQKKVFEKFKKTGKIEDYLKYICEKKKAMEIAQESSNFETKRRNSSKNN